MVEMALSHSAQAYITRRSSQLKLAEFHTIDPNQLSASSLAVPSQLTAYYLDRSITTRTERNTHTRTHGSRHSTPARIFARNKAERLRPAEMGEKMTVSLAFRGLSRDHHLERDLPNDDT